MTTGTEKQGKPTVELMKERLAMVAIGSCKECLYCEELPVAKIVGGNSCTHVCVLEAVGRWDEPLGGGEFITERSLDEVQYPTRQVTLEEVMNTTGCFAFMPQNGVEAPEPAEHIFNIKRLIKATVGHEKELGMKVFTVRIATPAENIQWLQSALRNLRTRGGQ